MGLYDAEIEKLNVIASHSMLDEATREIGCDVSGKTKGCLVIYDRSLLKEGDAGEIHIYEGEQFLVGIGFKYGETDSKYSAIGVPVAKEITVKIRSTGKSALSSSSIRILEV